MVSTSNPQLSRHSVLITALGKAQGNFCSTSFLTKCSIERPSSCAGRNVHKTVANIYKYINTMYGLFEYTWQGVMFCSRCRQLQDPCFRIGFATLRSTFQKGVVFNRTRGFPWLWLLQAPWTAFVLDLLVSSSVLITSFSARLVQEIIGFPDSRGCVLNTNADHETLGCFRFDLAVNWHPKINVWQVYLLLWNGNFKGS